MSFQDDQEILEKYLDENLNTVLGLRLAERYISLDNLEGAHQMLSEFLESHPNNATALFLLGEIAFKEGNNDKAKSQYEETIKLDPTFTTAYHRLIMISSDEGDNSGAADIQNLLKLLNPLDDRGTGSTDDVETAEVTKSEFSERVLNRLDLVLSESPEEAPVIDETTEEPEAETEATETDSEDEHDAAEETSETEPETEAEISTDVEDELTTDESIEAPESTETEAEETVDDTAESDIDSAAEDEAEPDSPDTGEEQESSTTEPMRAILSA
ncbi:MAG: tetratricopeptide repeat protein [Candidatus Marinimicrobia bacterium]|nr:tetratricopeptide repeat protein [Candidatus Neomarinimicrobiota bacterium]